MLLCEKRVVDARLVWEGKGWHATTVTTNNVVTVYVRRNGACIKLGSYQALCF